MRNIQCSGRTLAFLGDAVWSVKVRRYLIEHGATKGKQLQKESISYVSAKAQAATYTALHEEGFFTEEEEEIFRRGRNANEGSTPKNTDVMTYRMSTGFEAVIGALDLSDEQDRIDEIFARTVAMRK